MIVQNINDNISYESDKIFVEKESSYSQTTGNEKSLLANPEQNKNDNTFEKLNNDFYILEEYIYTNDGSEKINKKFCLQNELSKKDDKYFSNKPKYFKEFEIGKNEMKEFKNQGSSNETDQNIKSISINNKTQLNNSIINSNQIDFSKYDKPITLIIDNMNGDEVGNSQSDIINFDGNVMYEIVQEENGNIYLISQKEIIQETPSPETTSSIQNESANSIENDEDSLQETDLTNLTWLQNITNIMPAPPVSPTTVSPEKTEQPLSKKKSNHTILTSQEELMKIDLKKYKANGDKKPPFSYATLICMAMSKNGNKMTLAAIYSWIKENFLYYQHADPTWQNSIRHNLSLNKCFLKVARSKDQPGKGGFWKLDAERLKESRRSKRRNSAIRRKPPEKFFKNIPNSKDKIQNKQIQNLGDNKISLDKSIVDSNDINCTNSSNILIEVQHSNNDIIIQQSVNCSEMRLIETNQIIDQTISNHLVNHLEQINTQVITPQQLTSQPISSDLIISQENTTQNLIAPEPMVITEINQKVPQSMPNENVIIESAIPQVLIEDDLSGIFNSDTWDDSQLDILDSFLNSL